MSNSIGLYIHIPFCKHKCPYCDFFSDNADENAFDNYVIELKDKIKYWSEKAKRDVATVYFGGGTPSILGADRLCDILDFIKVNFNIKDKSKVLNFDYKKSIKYFSERNIKFDVIFADPPYDYHVIEKILTLIDKYDILNDNGIVVVEFEKEKLDNSYGKLNLIKDKKYGWRYIYIYKKC